MSALVVGIGHPFRRDDAVGWRVAQALTEKLALAGRTDVTILQHHGEGTDLMARWQGFDPVVLVDATSSGSMPGSVRYWDDCTLVPKACFPKSSHVFGLAEALALAADLGRLPPRLRVIGVEGSDFSAGDVMDMRVVAAVDMVMSLALTFIGAE